MDTRDLTRERFKPASMLVSRVLEPINGVRHTACQPTGIHYYQPPNPTIMFATRSFSLSLIAVCALGLVLAACDSTTPETNPGTPPALIASEAFSLSDTAFPDNNLVPGSDETNSVNGPHHTQAFFRVAIVSAAVGFHLLLPSAATGAATQVAPTVENGTWIWENTVNVNDSNVTFRLEGTPSGSSVDWQMFVSSGNFGGEAYDDFVLYTATTQINGQMGNWSLYYNIQGQRTRVLDAVYDETSSTARELTFSIPDTNPNQDAHGASVYYMADASGRVFDYQEPTPGQNHLIEWDAVTAAGSITAWDYNNGDQACWDSNLDNTPCVPAL